MPVIDKSKLPTKTGSSYPGGLNALVDGRSQIALGDPAGLTQFGVNLVTLAPGAISSLRHWHQNQDEFAMVTQGVCTLVDDHGKTTMQVGDCAAFPAGDANGHNIVNETDAPAIFLVVGTRTKTEVGHYSDVDLKVEVADGIYNFTRRDGSAVEDT